MTIPLYQDHDSQNTKPADGHTGLWFDRFFNGYNADWSLNDVAKSAWIKTVKGHTGDKKKLEAFSERQIILVNTLQGDTQRYTSDWHFITGMGNSHPVENGFSWHPTLAVPYLSGASVKGLVRAWVELNDDELSEDDNKARLKRWFGTAEKGDVAEQTGDFIFFDALPDEPPLLTCDIMTPHMGDWYSKGDESQHNDKNIPADWHEPIPVPFLVVKKTSFMFHIAPRSGVKTDELASVLLALAQALEWLGAGAKTAAGYGYMSEDTRYAEDLKVKQEKRQAAQEKKKQLDAKLANVSALAKTYLTAADKGDWLNDKNQFIQKGIIEEWLTTLESTPDETILDHLILLLNTHFNGLLSDPDKEKGKKKKPVYNDRQRSIAYRVNALK